MDRTILDEHEQPAARQERGRDRRRAAADENQRHRLEVARLRAVGRNLGAQLQEQVEKRPYVVVGAAAGIGFVAGSLFGSRLGQLILAAGLGYVVKNALGEDLGVERIRSGLEKLTGEAGTG